MKYNFNTRAEFITSNIHLRYELSISYFSFHRVGIHPKDFDRWNEISAILRKIFFSLEEIFLKLSSTPNLLQGGALYKTIYICPCIFMKRVQKAEAMNKTASDTFMHYAFVRGLAVNEF